MLEQVLQQYGLTHAKADMFGTGLINRTWKLTASGEEYILQRIEDKIFKQPSDIAKNIRLIADYLQQHSPGYLFVRPLSSLNGDDLVYIEGDGYYRLFPFIKDSHTIDVVRTPAQAFEAAAQFGKFTRLLSGFDANQLKISLSHFHDLELRYQQFLQALKNGNQKRIVQSKKLIEGLLKNENIVAQYKQIICSPQFKLRVTHHDTKISNVLFDKDEKAICIIDLDTLMPGYFISDVGDMMRTYLSPVSEEEQDVDAIIVREEFYKTIVQGYNGEMKDELTKEEKEHYFYAGSFMIYMQALRFLTDHLNNDLYYGARYEGQNYNRANNQFALLQRLMEKKEFFKNII